MPSTSVASPVRRQISWIPAHPAYGAMSMHTYWQGLHLEARPDDTFECHSAIDPPDQPQNSRKNKWQRYYQRRFGYPGLIRKRCHAPLAHILDHSWADMVNALPPDCATIVTVHDLIPLHFPGSLTEAQQNRFRQCVDNLRKADAVIAVSEHTKTELIDQLGILPGNIHVIPNGVSAPSDRTRSDAGTAEIVRRTTASTHADGVDRLRIGSLGNSLERKNLAVLAPALEQFCRDTPTPPALIRAGEWLPTALQHSLRAVHPDFTLLELGPVSEEGLEDFYAAIDVLVVPSLYEGFGLPVLEAMIRGVPVIAADATSLPEVGADAALYFDPGNPAALAARLRDVSQTDVRQRLSEAGRLRAGVFSWRQTLEAYYQVYEKVLAARQPA